jgi:hypothetical protein
MQVRRILTAATLTLSLVTVSYAGTITGSRTSASGSRTGTITGSRTGTITGSRAGTITGSRAGTITGSRVGTITGSRERLGFADDEFLAKIINLLISVSW